MHTGLVTISGTMRILLQTIRDCNRFIVAGESPTAGVWLARIGAAWLAAAACIVALRHFLGPHFLGWPEEAALQSLTLLMVAGARMGRLSASQARKMPVVVMLLMTGCICLAYLVAALMFSAGPALPLWIAWLQVLLIAVPWLFFLFVFSTAALCRTLLTGGRGIPRMQGEAEGGWTGKKADAFLGAFICMLWLVLLAGCFLYRGEEQVFRWLVVAKFCCMAVGGAAMMYRPLCRCRSHLQEAGSA